MKKLLVILMVLALLFSIGACGAGDETLKTEGQDAEGTAAVPDDETDPAGGPAQQGGAGTFDTISAFSDEWNRLNNLHGAAVNAYAGPNMLTVPLQLVMPALCFATGVQYEMLNINNTDGRYEGKLLLAGWQGYVEKSGSVLTFGYDDVRKEKGFSPNDLAGDRLVESGRADLAAGLYTTEQYTEREGVKTSRSCYDFARQSDGSIICIYMSGGLYGGQGDEDPYINALYVRIGEGVYEYAVAQGTLGTDFTPIALNGAGMSRDEAVSAFEAKGLSIVEKGSLQNGSLNPD